MLNPVILITRRGTQFKVAVVPEISRGLITANIIAIRPNHDQLSSIYLAAYLRSKDGGRELLAEELPKRPRLCLILSNVEELRIPLPPISVQEKLPAVEILDEEYQLNQAAVGIESEN